MFQIDKFQEKHFFAPQDTDLIILKKVEIDDFG